eukprot:1199970-Prymnesium_polylepis.1
MHSPRLRSPSPSRCCCALLAPRRFPVGSSNVGTRRPIRNPYQKPGARKTGLHQLQRTAGAGRARRHGRSG